MKLILKPFTEETGLSLFFTVTQIENRIDCSYNIKGDIRSLNLPKYNPEGRRHFLWLDTCFELFLKIDGDPHYYEFNFSPFQSFNIFHFAYYRAPMIESNDFNVALSPAIISDDSLSFNCSITPQLKLDYTKINFLPTVVIKKKGGDVSYWAAKHSLEKPDFHDPTTHDFRLNF